MMTTDGIETAGSDVILNAVVVRGILLDLENSALCHVYNCDNCLKT